MNEKWKVVNSNLTFSEIHTDGKFIYIKDFFKLNDNFLYESIFWNRFNYDIKLYPFITFSFDSRCSKMFTPFSSPCEKNFKFVYRCNNFKTFLFKFIIP